MLFSWNVGSGKSAAHFEYVQPTFTATADILVDPETNVLILSANTTIPPSNAMVYSLRTVCRKRKQASNKATNIPPCAG